MLYKIDFIELPDSFSDSDKNCIKGGVQCNDNCVINFNSKEEQKINDKSKGNLETKFKVKLLEHKKNDFCVVNVYF